jgi:hypothetical protein
MQYQLDLNIDSPTLGDHTLTGTFDWSAAGISNINLMDGSFTNWYVLYASPGYYSFGGEPGSVPPTFTFTTDTPLGSANPQILTASYSPDGEFVSYCGQVPNLGTTPVTCRWSLSDPPATVPELNLQQGWTALVLIAGAITILRARRA